MQKRLLICLLLLVSRPVQGVFNDIRYFDAIDGFLCIRSEFIRTVPNEHSKITCASHCSSEPLCKAFTMEAPDSFGVCQLYLFDQCSKRVRECGQCNARGRVFVRRLNQQLRTGALCPPGYGDDFCGTKYKLYSGVTTWNLSKAKCDSEVGLVIMADAIDAEEMTHIDALCNRTTTSTYLGGFQPDGSPEPDGGWIWINCNLPIDSNLWTPGEPNNNPKDQKITMRWHDMPKLSDIQGDIKNADGVLCECVSPFD